MKCMEELVKLDQEWVPYSTSSSLYIRPTFIGTDVRSLPLSQPVALFFRSRGSFPCPPYVDSWTLSWMCRSTG